MDLLWAVVSLPRLAGAGLDSRRASYEGNSHEGGTAWHGMAQPGTARHGMAQPGSARHGTAWQARQACHATAWHGTARYGAHGTAWHGTTRHGMAWHGTAQPGTA